MSSMTFFIEFTNLSVGSRRPYFPSSFWRRFALRYKIDMLLLLRTDLMKEIKSLNLTIYGFILICIPVEERPSNNAHDKKCA